MHEFVVSEDTDVYVQFKCIACNTVINFVKEQYGNPNPIRNETNTAWLPPENINDYLGPCQ